MNYSIDVMGAVIRENNQKIIESNFKFSRSSIIYFGIFNTLLFIVLATIGNFNTSKLINEFNTNTTIIQHLVLISRRIFSVLGPILGFSIYICIQFYFFYDVIKETEAVNDLLGITIISGIASIIFAITLNNSAILAGISFFGALNMLQNVLDVSLFAFAIIAPTIEEIAKGLPLYILSKGVFTYWGKRERRLVGSFQIFILLGMIVGGIFTLLETYWYIFNIGYVFDITYEPFDEGWRNIFGQIMIRTLSPLHIATGILMGVGVAISVYQKNSINMEIRDYGPFYRMFGLSVLLHGLWNGTLVFAEFVGLPSFVIFYYDFPLLLILYFLIIIFIIYYSLKKNLQYPRETCTTCGLWHQEPFDFLSHDIKEGNIESRTSIQQKILGFAEFSCHSCNNQIGVNGYCEICAATNIFTCGQCVSPIPVYSTECWSCKYPLNLAYEQVFRYKPNFFTNLAIGFTRFLASFYVPVTLSLILYAIIFQISDAIVIHLFFFTFMGIAYVIAIYWLSNEKTKGKGVILGRTFLSIFFFQFGFTLFFLGNLMVIFGLIVPAVIYYFESGFIFILLYPILLKYRPVIHGGNEK